MNDGPGVVPAVDAQMQRDLGGGREVSGDESAVEVDHADLVGGEVAEHRAGRGDRHRVTCACADVAGGPHEEPLVGKAARGGCDLRTQQVVGHSATPVSPAGVAWFSR